MARTPRATPTPARTQQRTQQPAAAPRPPPNESEGWRRLSKDAWKEKFAAFVRRPSDGRRALQAVVSGEDATATAGVGVPIDLCELARFDAGAAQGLLRWPEKLLPVFDEALNDGVKLLASQAASRHPDWRERKARARLRHCRRYLPTASPTSPALRCGDVGPARKSKGRSYGRGRPSLGEHKGGTAAWTSGAGTSSP